MANYDGLTPGQVLADASVADFIKSLGLGIAEAQRALDENSIQQIAEFVEPREGLGGRTLLDLGLSPAFYHYQHADLSCSLQLTLRVEKDTGLSLDLSGSYNDGNTNNENFNEAQNSSESGSSSSSETRQASVNITSASAGTLVVGGQNYSLNGSTPAERIRNLQLALTTDDGSGIDRVLYELESTPLTITETPDDENVHTTSNTVAFTKAGFDSAIIRIATGDSTEYVLNGTDAISVQPSANLTNVSDYAASVASAIAAEGYETHHVKPADLFRRITFATGRHEVAANDYERLVFAAKLIKQLQFPVKIQGFTDRQVYSSNSDALNKQLGDNRAKEVKRILMANGAPESLLELVASQGDKAAKDAGDAVDQDNPSYRRVDITFANTSFHMIVVHATETSPNLDLVSPDKQAANSTGNGFIYVYNPTPLNLAGKSVTIDNTVFPYRGAANGSFAANSPEAFAKNLADDINAHASADLQASATANVVTISKKGDQFKLTLVTTSSRNLSLSGTSGVTVASQFSRSSSSNLTHQNTGNKTVAFGASLDARFSRQFEMNVTGNSSISARLVSIPAPPEFLATIREYLSEGGN